MIIRNTREIFCDMTYGYTMSMLITSMDMAPQIFGAINQPFSDIISTNS